MDLDPDLYSEYGSGSRKLLNTDPIRIRIHNTARHHVPDSSSSHSIAQLQLLHAAPSKSRGKQSFI